MVTVTNKRVVLNEFLKNHYVPGQTTSFDSSQTIDTENVPLNGGVLLKALVLSLEPYLLYKMRGLTPDAYKIGDAIKAFGVGVVVRSENPAFRVGDHLYGQSYPFAEYSVHINTEGFSKIDNKYDLPWSVFVGIAGMPGQTAYFGWKEHSHPKKGEIVFVSSGAGAVGSLVIQLAKRDGLKVIASAGSDDKVQFLKDLGADVAFNYKTTKTSEVLEKEGPIDIYWDNVGGETLDTALGAAAQRARFIECGMLSGYFGDTYPMRNLMNIVVKEISVNGFVVFNLSPKYLEVFKREVPSLLESKELIHREEITTGLENAEEAFDRFLKGAVIGKSIVVV